MERTIDIEKYLRRKVSVMYRKANQKKARILAGIIAVMMLVSTVPVNMLTATFAAVIDGYTVNLTDGTSILDLDGVDVTLTNKEDETKSETVSTVDGVATFESFVEDGATYVLSVSEIIGYETVIDTEIVPVEGVDESTDVVLTAIEKVTVSGVVTDENDDVYEGATVTVTGYDTVEVETDENGQYSLSIYKGKEITFTVTPKAEDVKYNVHTSTATYNADTTVDVKLQVKTYDVTTNYDNIENGTITESEDDIVYGGDKDIEIIANPGYRIDKIVVTSESAVYEVEDVNGLKSHSLTLSDICENYNIVATFYRMSYKVSFTVGENGKLIYDNNESDAIVGGSVTVDKIFEESTDENNPTKVTIVAIPEANYRVSKVLIDGVETTYDVNDFEYNTDLIMSKDYTFEVVFSINKYTLNVECGANGSAQWGEDGTQITVNHGENATLNITPEEEYDVSEVIVNGTPVDVIVENGKIYIEFTDISKNLDVKVNFEKPNESVPTERVDNDYYKITYDEAVKTYVDGDLYVIVLPYDGVATLTPVNPYTGIKYNTTNPNFNYKSSIEISSTTTIENVFVKSGGFAGDKEQLTVNIKIIIDTVAPTLADIEQPDWTKEDTVTISGTASDGTSNISGLEYFVWSDSALTDDQVIAETTNRDEFNADGSYSFTINSSVSISKTFYVYAVDYAGNVSDAKAVVVKIDKTIPEVKGFDYSTEKGNIVKDLINFLTFGTICKKDMYVTVSASDGDITSGIASIVLYYGDGKSITSAEIVDGKAIFKLTEDEFGSLTEIKAVVKDNVGNESVATKPTDEGVTSEAQSNNVQISSSKPQIVITPSTAVYTDGAGNLWYAGDTELNVVVKDSVAGISAVEIYINGVKLIKDANNIELSQDFAGTTDELSFKVNTSQLDNRVEGVNTIKVVAINSADTESASEQKVYIDTDAADISSFEITTINGDALSKVLNFLSFGIFFKEQVKVTVSGSDIGSGVKNITLLLDDVVYETKDIVDDKASFIVTKDQLTVDSVIKKSISAKASDNVGNETQTAVIPTTVNSDIKNSGIMLENKLPVVDVTYTPFVSDMNENTKDDNEWYKSDAEFIINVSDEDSGLRNVTITINGTELVNKSYVGDGIEEEKHNDTYTVSTADEKVAIADDGSYTLAVVVTDNAGNVNGSYKKVIYKDTEVPYIIGFDFEPENYVEGDENEVNVAPVEKTEYGFYFKESTKVTIYASDISSDPDVLCSGVKYISYYTVDYTTETENGVTSEIITVPVDQESSITITIPANFKGQIYAKATDNVENIAENYVTPDSAIVENEEMHKKEQHIAFDKEDTSFKTNDGVDLYADNVEITITVTDTYSGIREVEWSVVAPYDTDNNQSGKVVINNDKTLATGNGYETDWNLLKTELNLVTEMKKTVTVKNNSNDVLLKVTMTDRAGNKTTEEIKVSIDKTAPSIVIVYDDANEVHDDEYTDIFNTFRTATITVTERNFNASDIVYAISNTDKTIPTVDLSKAESWKVSVNREDADKTTYTATVVYGADGDYTFDMSYKDMVGNVANAVAQHKFTIDMTKPVVSVKYDNNASLNGNYFKNDRIATITIKEHNFDALRVKIMGIATDNGNEINFPVESAWKDNGNDTYTAVITYNSDAKYTFDIEFNDKANNSIDDYATEEFYVDKTAPNLSISGVVDKSANSGDVIPVITYTDTNFDKTTVVISLTGVNSGVVEYSANMTDTANGLGQIYTYENFENVQAVDDIYTLNVKLSDKAGNETQMTISFSVNRFGSVYDISQTADINNKYLTTSKDIIITETNIDGLDTDKIVVKMTKNGTPTDLVYGKQYTYEVTGGDGKWSVYKYTIFKENFEDDGKYSITISTTDAAGNVNENVDESKTAEITFGVDKTEPVIIAIDLESGKQYAIEGKTATMEIKDNLVLETVKIYLNDVEVEYIVDGENYTFDIPESSNVQKVRVEAIDAAGNNYELLVEDFLVTTDMFVRWYNNTPLFIGSIAGVVLVVLGITIFILFGKKRKVNN